MKNNERIDSDTRTDTRKQAVSIRMNRSDVRNIKRLAERLGARDSEVIRFAVKLMLGRLSLLQDPAVRGRSLVPVFLEAGPEFIRYFELDYARLSSIINEGVDQDRCVDPDDIQLIAMHGLQRSYLKLRVAGIRRVRVAEAVQDAERTANGNGAAARDHSHGELDEEAVDRSLRQYLYEKYLYADDEPGPVPLATSIGGGT